MSYLYEAPIPSVLEGIAGADGPGLDVVGERHGLHLALSGDRVELGRAAQLVERAQDPGADALGLGLAAGGAQPAPADPGVERPDGPAVVGVRREDRRLRRQGPEAEVGQHVRRAQARGDV